MYNVPIMWKIPFFALFYTTFCQSDLGLGNAKNKVPRYTAVFSRVPRYLPWYTATVLNFAEVIVKLPAVVAIWLKCQHLMVYKFKPPQSSVPSFIFNEILIYIIYCNRNLYFKLKISRREWRLEIHVGP